MKLLMRLQQKRDRSGEICPQGRPSWENVETIGPIESSPQEIMLRMTHAGWASKILDSSYRVTREWILEKGEEEHSLVK